MSTASSLKSAARGALKSAASGLDRLRTNEPGITVLIYHRVGATSGGQMNIDRPVFERQLEWLSRNCEVITLDEALDRLGAGADTPPGRATPGARPEVVITFDDGTIDWIEHVLPALEDFGIPATFYVATAFVDEQMGFPLEGRPLSWEDVRELACSPMATIGSHTHRHRLLDRVDGEVAADELDRSVELLGSKAGVVAEHFAYPKAVAGSPAAQAEVRKRFRSAVIAGTRANQAGVDPHLLHRSPIQASDSFEHFRRKALGGMRTEDDLRALANRIRYRRLAS